MQHATINQTRDLAFLSVSLKFFGILRSYTGQAHNKVSWRKQKDTDFECGPMGELGNRWNSSNAAVSFRSMSNVLVFSGNFKPCA